MSELGGNSKWRDENGDLKPRQNERVVPPSVGGNIAELPGDYVLFKDGDGVGRLVSTADRSESRTTESFADVGALLNDVFQNERASVLLASDFTYTTNITATQPFSFIGNRGSPRGGSRMDFDGTGPAFTIQPPAGSPMNEPELRNIWFDGADSGGNGVYLDSTNDAIRRGRFENIWISSFGATGWAESGKNIYLNGYDNIRSYYPGSDGFAFSGRDNVIGRIQSYNAGNDGVALAGTVARNDFWKVYTNQSGRDGLRTNGKAALCQFAHIFAEDNAGVDANFRNGLENSKIGRLASLRAGSDGIVFRDCNEVIVDQIEVQDATGWYVKFASDLPSTGVDIEHIDLSDGAASTIDWSGAIDATVDRVENNNGPIAVDAFAGETTDSNGQVSVTFDATYTVKPDLSISTESAGSWHVASWSTDGSGRYNGVTLQLTDGSGAAVGSGLVANVNVERMV